MNMILMYLLIVFSSLFIGTIMKSEESKHISNLLNTKIAQYANNLVDKLKARFPSTPFLDALKILDPQEWKRNCELYTNSGIMIIIILIDNYKLNYNSLLI